jgi:DNA-binding HxlR family transcriptional regulator
MAEDASRSYGHFCTIARALERVGDRWALLIIRDLSTGPKRFTDLIDRLAGVTPKTLTRRLRELEADGLVTVDREAGRREVWYRLTVAGEELRPTLDELLVWGLRHLTAPPGPDEPVHPDHMLRALHVMLQREAVDVGKVCWAVHVPGTGTYVLRGDGPAWELRPSSDDVTDADVTITASRSGLARFLTSLPTNRDPRNAGIEIAGKAAAVRTFLKAMEVFPFGRHRVAVGQA